MALNFLGLGFNFGSQDKGLADSIKTTSSGLSDISKSVVSIGLASSRMGLKMPNISPLLNQATGLASDMKLHTTQLEAFGVQASKTSSAGLAGLNLTSKAFRKAKSEIAGVAFSMNTDVGAVTQSFVALKQSQIDIRKFGFKSFKQYQKFIEITGADSAKFAGSLGKLTNQMGLSEKQATDLVKSTAAIGKKFNIGREAVSGMAETVDLLNRNSNLLPHNWDPKRIATFVKGTTRLAGALTSVGLTADEAMKASQGLTGALLKNETGLQKLYTGIDKGLPGMSKTMIKHLGSAKDAFKVLQDDPAAFMKNMGGLVEHVRGMNLSPDALNMFRLEMESTFGKDTMATFTKQGMDKIGPALDAASKPIEGQDKILQSLASRYEDGRTAAERFAIAQDRLLTKMKTIKGVMSDQEYLKKYKKNTDALYRTLNKTAKKGGPLGKMTTMLIEMRTKGIGGAIASHSEYGMALAELSNQFGPILKTLPGVAMAFAALASPITLVAGAIGGLYFVFKDLEKGNKSIVRPWIKKLKKEAPKILEAVKNAFTKALSVIGKVITYVVDRIDFKKVGQVLGHVLERSVQFALVVLQAAFKLGEKMLIWINGLDWKAIGHRIGVHLGAAFLIAFVAVRKVVMKLPEILMNAVRIAVDGVIGILGGVEDYLIKKFPKSTKTIQTVFAVLKSIVYAFGEVAKATIKLVVGGFKLIGRAAMGVVNAVRGVGNVVNSVLDATVGRLFDGADAVKINFKGMADDLERSIVRAHVAAVKSAAKQIKTVKQLNSETNLEVRKLVQEQLKSGKLFETSTGKLLKANQVITKYAMDAHGGLVKVNHELAKMHTAEINTPSLKEGKMLMAEYAAATNKARASGKSLGDVTDSFTGRFADFRKKYGIIPQHARHLNKVISEQLAIHDDVIVKVAKVDAAYADSLKIRQQQIATEFGNKATALRKLQDAELAMLVQKGITDRKSVDAVTARHSKAMKGLLTETKIYTDRIAESAKILIGKVSDTMSKFNKDTKKGREDLLAFSERAAMAWSNTIRAQGRKAVDSLRDAPQASKDAVDKIYKDIAKAQQNELQAFLQNTALKGAALDREVKGIQAKYAKIVKTVHTKVGEASDNLIQGTEASFKRFSSKLIKDNKFLGDNLKAQTNKFTGEIEKTMEVSADKAADMVGVIANIDPRKFRKNMKVIKREYVGFIKKMVKGVAKMMNDSAKFQNLYWKTSEAGWRGQTSLLQAWSSQAEVHIRKYWTAVVKEAGKAALGFVGFVKKIQGALIAQSKAINVMDLLASPSQISRWATSVVSALSHAFAGGSAADSMIAASYNKALNMSVKMGRQTANPAGDGSDTSTGVVSHAGTSLLGAINDPAWTRKKDGPIPSELREINENLRSMLNAMSALGSSPQRSGTKPRRRRTYKR